MAQDSPVKRFLFDCGTRDVVGSTGLAVLRVSVGLMMMLGNGLPKLRAYDALKAGWHVPEIFPLCYLSPQLSLIATIGAELVAAALLVCGLLTRPAAFVLGFAMVVAAFDVHGAHPWVTQGAGPSKELALLYLVPALVFLLSGAGAWSLDANLYREPKRRYW